MTRNVRMLVRRMVAFGAASAVLGGAAVGLAARADAELSVADVGVAISGPQTAVTNGLDALIKATLHNDGLLAASNAVLTVATGGKVDTALPLPANCTVSTGTTDTVHCSYGTLPATTTEPTVQIAVTTPASGTSMVSTASGSTTTTAVVVGDDDQSKSWTTTLSPTAPCGTDCTQAFVPEGGSVTRTSSSGVSQTFSVPAGATWTGGGMLVTLDEQNTTTDGITCGGQPCRTTAGEVKFQPLDSSSTPDPNNPVVNQITYSATNICSASNSDKKGLGDHDTYTCPPLYSLPTGQTTGNATAVVNCTTFGTSNTVASTDPCVNAEATSANSVTFTVAADKDLTLPLFGGSK